MEGTMDLMKIIINQANNGFFTVGVNQYINISRADINGTELFSVGIQNISIGIYKKEKRAITVFNQLLEFVSDDTRSTFRVEQDK